jgi:glutamate racemase
LPAQVSIVDSAATTAQALAAGIASRPPATRDPGGITVGGVPVGHVHRGRVHGTRFHGGRIRWLATDDAERFARVGGRFFGAELHADAVEIIDL